MRAGIIKTIPFVSVTIIIFLMRYRKIPRISPGTYIFVVLIFCSYTIVSTVRIKNFLFESRKHEAVILSVGCIFSSSMAKKDDVNYENDDTIEYNKEGDLISFYKFS